MTGQQFVYEEDDQGYWHNHVLMAQESDAPIPIAVKNLENLSWKVPGAGRLSTSADALIKIANQHKLKLRIIERREKSKNVPMEWSHLPLVRGATGNY